MTRPVIIATSDAVIAEALAALLDADQYSCTQAQSPEDCKEKLVKTGAKLVVWDASALEAPPADMAAVVITDSKMENFPVRRQLIKPFRAQQLTEALSHIVNESDVVREELAEGWSFCAMRRELANDETGQQLTLTEKETEILQALLEEKGNPISREALLEKIWGYDQEIDTHTLETHLYRLRGKLKEACGHEKWIETTEKGYCLKL